MLVHARKPKRRTKVRPHAAASRIAAIVTANKLGPLHG